MSYVDTSKLNAEQKARYAILEDKWANSATSGDKITEEEVKEYCDLMVIIGEFIDHKDGTYSLNPDKEE